MNRKKRILFISEAAYLNTGYAKYSKEVISRIYDSGKYDIAEFSIYGSETDPRRSQIRWKNYPNLPNTSDEQQVAKYNSNTINQFGAWRFERVCLDYKPDIVFTIRDYWMDSFIYHSPYRRLFSWAWMPTVDASPQNQEWLDVFCDVDYVLTYSDWAKNLLESQAGKKINTVGTASPSASEDFIPLDRKRARESLQLRDDVNIVGTVMRNQRRKLFPALIEGFGNYIKSSKSKNTYLYLHTSFPDAGWNLAELIYQNGISSKVLMTYVCEKCKNIETSFFRDSRKVCNKCKKFASTPSSVGNGVSDADLAKIYNSFDLYIQCANSEGFGLPQVEAAACGIPIACTNYSAMEDIVNKLDAYPISYSTYKELETGCDRAVPNIESIEGILTEFFDKDKKQIMQDGTKTRKLFEKHYSWDKTAEAWMKIADMCEYGKWNDPINIIPIQDIKTEDIKSNFQLFKFMMNNYIFYEPHKHSYFSRNILSDIQRGLSKNVYDSYYVSEFSPYSSNRARPITSKSILEALKNKLHNYNLWESVRLDSNKSVDRSEAWLN
jgi:glycosyltransferase involved in cell wall biosynthesis